MKLTVRKLFFGGWCWECPVCHYGENMPWREVSSFEAAWSDAEAHLALHAVMGMRLEWAPVRELH